MADNAKTSGAANSAKSSEEKIPPVRHPAWRVYQALELAERDPAEFELATGVPILYLNKAPDPVTLDLVKALKGEEFDDSLFELQDCLSIFTNIYERQLIEGLLLDGKTPAEVAEVLGCKEGLALTYSTVFYDTSVFLSNMDKLYYVRKGLTGSDARVKREISESGFHKYALGQGLNVAKMNMDELLMDTAALAFMRMNTGALSDDTLEQQSAQGWAKVLIQIAAQLGKKKGGGLTIQDLVIQLQDGKDRSKVVNMDDLK